MNVFEPKNWKSHFLTFFFPSNHTSISMNDRSVNKTKIVQFFIIKLNALFVVACGNKFEMICIFVVRSEMEIFATARRFDVQLIVFRPKGIAHIRVHEAEELIRLGRLLFYSLQSPVETCCKVARNVASSTPSSTILMA